MDPLFDKFYFAIDGGLISLYRLTGIAMVDYLIGTFLLSMIAVVIGDISVALAIRYNRGHIRRLGAQTDRMEKMSINAYQEGNMERYRALNKAATDSWGKHFFTMAAYSAGILWPIPFVLGWMQYRFHDVAFPVLFPLSFIVGDTVGYIFTFFPIYILARICFKYLRPVLRYLRRVNPKQDDGTGKDGEEERLDLETTNTVSSK